MGLDFSLFFRRKYAKPLAKSSSCAQKLDYSLKRSDFAFTFFPPGEAGGRSSHLLFHALRFESATRVASNS